MVCGNTFLKCNRDGVFVMWVNATYNMPLNRNTIIMTEKLKEKMINNRDPITAVIISANNEMGRPMIIARFLMFL
tara:strand:+ start:7506 stop:7730 length:225 start_codon:yes stop_codon:yes gene_type:complete